MKYDFEKGSELLDFIEANKNFPATLLIKGRREDFHEIIDSLARASAFGDDLAKRLSQYIIRATAINSGIIPCSIQPLYEARGKGSISGFTVPAINIRCLTYDVARAVLRAAMKSNCGAFIFEIARSEISYTNQRPEEYATVIMAAALREGFKGPIFLQGDHYQINKSIFKKDPEKEIDAIEKLIVESISAGFYNIDIDTSTLVDLEKDTIEEQQRLNFEICAHFTDFIRKHQPEGINISIGGEIGEVGAKNSTVEELRAFMKGYRKLLSSDRIGISKISVQTGTVHGGIVLPDGSVAKINLDFHTLYELSRVAREEFQMAGAVQHGASTLPPQLFHKFPEVETAEIHLATEFQNIILDSVYFPKDLLSTIYNFLKREFSDERKHGETEAQFLYKTRKKALGPFKREIWDIPENARNEIAKSLEEKFLFLFDQLKVSNTKGLIDNYIKPVVKMPEIPGEIKRLLSQ